MDDIGVFYFLLDETVDWGHGKYLIDRGEMYVPDYVQDPEDRYCPGHECARDYDSDFDCDFVGCKSMAFNPYV
jgi:hypothetical protein